jgi:hypothetical protein
MKNVEQEMTSAWHKVRTIPGEVQVLGPGTWTPQHASTEMIHLLESKVYTSNTASPKTQ